MESHDPGFLGDSALRGTRAVHNAQVQWGLPILPNSSGAGGGRGGAPSGSGGIAPSNNNTITTLYLLLNSLTMSKTPILLLGPTGMRHVTSVL